jgi:hypothetical protein
MQEVEIVPWTIWRREAVSPELLKRQPALREWTEEHVAGLLGRELINFLRCHKNEWMVVKMKENWDEGMLDEVPPNQIYEARVLIYELPGVA